MDIFDSFSQWLIHYLERLDPSLFQNLILGILTIFIPFAIVIIADIFKSEKEKSEFKKMVVSEEVLGIKWIFWFAVISMLTFALLSATTWVIAKIASIALALCFIFLFWRAFARIFRFSEGNKSDFEVSFLRKLKFSRIFKFKNKGKSKKMARAWKSFWSEKSEYDEFTVTEIFISNVDDSIKHKKLDLAAHLSQAYMENIDKRDVSLICARILPKVLQWEEKLRVKRMPDDRNNFFKEVSKMLLQSGHSSFYFFFAFKKYVDRRIKKMNETINKTEKNRAWHYIKDLLKDLCQILFNETGSDDLIIGYDFPKAWKISMATKSNLVSKVVLNEFLEWSRDKICKHNEEADYDKGLSTIISSIFPNVHPRLFREFLMLYSLSGIQDALSNKPNFRIFSAGMHMRFSSDASEEDREKKFDQAWETREISQKRYTAQVILKFFLHSYLLEAFQHYTKASAGEWQPMSKRDWRETFEKMKDETESDEIKAMCEKDEIKEWRRQDILELLDLLIKEVGK